MRDAQVMRRGIQGLALNAANLMFEIPRVVADSIARRRG